MPNEHRRLPAAALGFACLDPSYDRSPHALQWLDSRPGIRRVALGMHRQGYDLQLTQYDDRGCAGDPFYTTGIEHWPTSADGVFAMPGSSQASGDRFPAFRTRLETSRETRHPPACT